MNFVEIIQNKDSEKSRQISTKLGYQSAYFQNSQDWYPSLVDSGTSQRTRVHQARVPICQFSKLADWYSRASQIGPFPARDFFTNSREKAFNRAGVCPKMCSRCTSITSLVNIVAILKINGLHPRVFAVVVV